MHYSTLAAGLTLISLSLALPHQTSNHARSQEASITKSNLSPNGRKAGLSGYKGIQNTQAFKDLASSISWYSDYHANTPTTQNVQGIGMLWGGPGSACGSTEQTRLTEFDNLINEGVVPEIMFGFYEPDCNCPSSSQMSVASSASDWTKLLAPLGARGTVLGSPSMCKQKDEDFLTPFNASITRTWDVTSIHINKPDLAGAKADVEYYVNKYKKPIWVSEFACVFDQGGFNPCTDQNQINQFINDVVEYFEGNEHVVAYGPSNGEGLGTVWPLTTKSGELSATGQTYLNAIKNL